MSLKGGPQLRARLKAIKLSFKPLGKDWADETVTLARPMVPNRTGRLRQSIRRKNATQTKATVVAHYTAYFVDKGTKAHVIVPKRKPYLVFQAGGRTIFTKRVNHPAVRGRPFRERAAREALRRRPMAAAVIREWNRAKGRV